MWSFITGGGGKNFLGCLLRGEDRLLGNLGNMGNKFSTDYGLLLLDAFPSLKLQERRLHLEELSSVLRSTSVLEEVRFSAQHSSL